jgi:hypothetical protein
MDYQQPRGAVWLAGAYVNALNLVGNLLDRLGSLSSPAGLENARTPDDVRAFARRIERTDPSFASDLKAAADRADNELQ